MSILSCEKFLCDHLYVSVIRKKNAVELAFEQAPRQSTSVTVSDSSGSFQSGQSVVINGDLAVPVTITNASISTGYLNSSSQFITTGYKLFMHKGYLKCVKREISSYDLCATSSTTFSLQLPSSKHKNVRESFYHPASATENYYTPECRQYILSQIIDLAEQNGIKIPEKFKVISDHYNGLNAGWQMPALDWLAYPLIREIDNVVICKNMLNPERNVIAPNFEAKSFKELVQHYYGTTTPKLLEEVWKVITVGGDFRRVQFSPQALLQSNVSTQIYQQRHPFETIETGENYLIQTGDRHVNTQAFHWGPALLKNMGFDYFYQCVHFLTRSYDRRYASFGEDGVHNFSNSLKTLLKYVTPKKFISAFFEDFKPEEERKKPDFHSLNDTAMMLNHYDSFDKIPASLRLQYPQGLTVDFKFKTMKELHDKISTQYTIIKTESERKPIPVNAIYMQLDGKTREGLTLRVPTNTATLSIWGKLLNICIASYGDRAARCDTLLLGVEEEGRIKYCIEFYSVIVPRPGPGDFAGTVDPLNPLAITVASYERDVYPRLLEKHAGVLPPDVPEEEGIHHIPDMVQFRSERNGDPSQKDRDAVECMLVEWVKENFEFLKEIKDIFKPKMSLNFGEWGGQPDQIVMAPQQYNALAQALGNENRFVMNPNIGAPILQNNGINVVVDNALRPDQIFLMPNGDLPPVHINNIGV